MFFTRPILEIIFSLFYVRFPSGENGNQTAYQGTGSNGVNMNGTVYCQNNECKKATAAAFFIGLPCIIIVSFCVLTLLGFTCGGVAGGSAAAACQATCYGGLTSGVFSLLQSAGAGGCPICFVIIIVILGGLPCLATHFLCPLVCDSLNS